MLSSILNMKETWLISSAIFFHFYFAKSSIFQGEKLNKLIRSKLETNISSLSCPWILFLCIFWKSCPRCHLFVHEYTSDEQNCKAQCSSIEMAARKIWKKNKISLSLPSLSSGHKSLLLGFKYLLYYVRLSITLKL